MFESKIKVEWEAFKNKDKKAYAELLADDYQGVEVDRQGERNKIQAINELAEQNVFSYTLWGYKMIPLGPDAAFVIYESTMQFPPKSQIRFSRVYISELWVKRCGAVEGSALSGNSCEVASPNEIECNRCNNGAISLL